MTEAGQHTIKTAQKDPVTIFFIPLTAVPVRAEGDVCYGVSGGRNTARYGRHCVKADGEGLTSAKGCGILLTEGREVNGGEGAEKREVRNVKRGKRMENGDRVRR